MPRIVLLPHPQLCPGGAAFEAPAGANLCDTLLANGITIEHACEKAGACATCHVVIRAGAGSLGLPFADEEDQLDGAWGLTATSRLACRVRIGRQDLALEIPRYSRNHAGER